MLWINLQEVKKIYNDRKMISLLCSKETINYSSMLIFGILICTFFLGCASVSTQDEAVGSPPKPVTVPEILEMTEAGIPPFDIIEQMKQSKTVYRLKASQLARLKEEGVSDEVINYMQQTYIDAVKRNQAFEDWDNWTLGGDGYWYGGPYFGGPGLWW